MTRARRSWSLFAMGAALVLGALGWITKETLDLENRELRAKWEAHFQEALRLALWRVDSRLTAMMALEAARPVSHYSPFYTPENSLKHETMAPLRKGDVLVPSPLLDAAPEFFRLHFQIDAQGNLTSPQVPDERLGAKTETWTANALNAFECKDQLATMKLSESFLKEVVPELAVPDMSAPRQTVQTAQGFSTDLRQEAQREAGDSSREDLMTKEFSNRRNTNVQAQRAVRGQGFEATGLSNVSGPLTPYWDFGAGGSEPELFFLRRVTDSNGSSVQGIWVDWPRLETWLLEDVHDLLPGARFIPIDDPEAADPGRMLASIPAALQVSAGPHPPCAPWTPTRVTLLLVWVAIGASLAGVGWVLHAAMELGERRGRFVSAVTHELRTPLTTFRMYSQMLADSMVVDESARQEYLETLKLESDRLARVVESVLLYANVEDGRGGSHRVRIAASELLERVLPVLTQRAVAGAMEFEINAEKLEECVVDVDVQAVEQILLNLVDNACKYASAAFDRRLCLEARAQKGELEIVFSDHGPGISPEEQEIVFLPFRRASAHAAGPIPGVGLGLALARGLARALGGDFELLRRKGKGATFRLTLPREA